MTHIIRFTKLFWNEIILYSNTNEQKKTYNSELIKKVFILT